MRMIDSHFHYWPRAVWDKMCARNAYPRAERNDRNGYIYLRREGREPAFNVGPVWFDVDKMLERMDQLGFELSVISSIGPISMHFSDMSPEEGRDHAMAWNEEMAKEQRRLPGRFWGTAAVPLTNVAIALDVLNHAVVNLGLVGVNVPGSIGDNTRLDAAYLEPFYDRVEELGIPMFIHPTDTMFDGLLDGYDGALYLGLGRVMDVSVAAARLIYSGLMERHPNLKVYMSHTGGALPYQSGRMDKSFSKGIKLPHPTSTYIKRMYTDMVSPHTAGMKFAVEYYGADHIIYGTDYPCWNPSTALDLFQKIGLSQADQEKIMGGNAIRVFNLPVKVPAAV